MSGQPEKICPKCSQRSPLDAGFCGNCQHQFRTRFTPPADQTIMAPPPMGAPAVSYNPVAAVSGPLDDTERSVSMTWTFIGCVATGVVMLYGTQKLTIWTLAGLWDLCAYWVLGMLVSGSLFSFLVMRFRRLYLSMPGGVNDPREVAARRRKFAVWSTSGIIFLALAGAAIAIVDVVRVSEEVARGKAAAARQERKEQEQVAREAEERRRRDEEARQRLQSIPQRQDYSPPAFQLPPPAQPPSGAFRVAPPPARRSSGLPPLGTPDKMPCGHPFAKFEADTGFGANGGYVAVCTLGHRAKIVNGRWVSIPF